ncbi:MAG: hypothetical protein U0457_01320 [Candidatus Sericytochromatia bacterium]
MKILKKLINFGITSLIAVSSFTACSREAAFDESLDENQVLEEGSKSSKVSSQSISYKINSRSDFDSELSKQNVKLAVSDYDMIKKLARVKPIGQWTPGPENNSAANQKKHFIKHGHDFKPPYNNENDYLKGAIAAFNNTAPESNFYMDLDYYKKDKIVSLVKWNSKTYEITVVRVNGQTATYFLDNKLKQNRFILVPNDLK